MDGLMTTNEVAKMLDVQRQTVTKHIGRGNLKARRIGRDYFVKREDAEEFKRTRRKPGWQWRNGGKKKAS